MKIQYEVCSAVGRTIKTFDERRAATRYASEIAETFPGAYAEEVSYPEPQRRRLWTDRSPERGLSNIVNLRSA